MYVKVWQNFSPNITLIDT